MRASRLLQILLLLQNRGRLTAPRLAEELEVTPRTILRDVDAMTEAGLPILTLQGQGGGIELGFNYRTRLTGLAEAEAEAIGILLASPAPLLEAIGLGPARRHAAAKLIESLPDRARAHAERAARQVRLAAAGPDTAPDTDPRIPALALAIRETRIVRIQARSADPQSLHPVRLTHDAAGWAVACALTGQSLPLDSLGDVNISSRRFAASPLAPDAASVSLGRD
jgi:predicted DNA-binding transcriptional regulator YafY